MKTPEAKMPTCGNDFIFRNFDSLLRRKGLFESLKSVIIFSSNTLNYQELKNAKREGI